MKKTLVVIGAGKGLGSAIAEKFGLNDFKVILMARSKEKLEKYQKDLASKGIEVYIHRTDVSDFARFANDYKEVIAEHQTPEVIFYNVGITTPDSESNISAETLINRYKTDVAGAYNLIQLIDIEEFARKNGAILITGGGLGIYPYHEYLPLSMDKAALRAMVQALAPVYKEKGIFIGTIQITNVIGSNEHFAPKTIAKEFWKLYTNRTDSEIIY